MSFHFSNCTSEMSGAFSSSFDLRYSVSESSASEEASSVIEVVDFEQSEEVLSSNDSDRLELTALHVHAVGCPILVNRSPITLDEIPIYLFTHSKNQNSRSGTLFYSERNVSMLVKDKIGEGSFAEVKRIYHSTFEGELIIKIAKWSEKAEDFRNAFLLNDYNMHLSITQGKKRWGIQDQPRSIMQIQPSTSDRPRVGYICSAYDMDLSQLMRSTSIDKSFWQESNMYFMIDQILSALAHFEENEFFDMDRKPTNFLFKWVTVNGRHLPLVHFSDFGGTVRLADLKHRIDPVCTDGYYSPIERERFLELKFHHDPALYKSKALSLPIYGYGVTLYRLLTDKKPFLLDTQTHRPIGNYIEMDNPRIPEAIQSLVRLMLDPSKERTGRQIKQAFDDFLNANHPEISVMIGEAKRILGYFSLSCDL